MDHKIGVYICSGCKIGNSLNIEGLEKLSTGELKAPICRKHNFLCDKDGVKLIKEDIEKEGVNTVVIAACSNRVNYDVFDFGKDVIVERANLREYVAWSHTAEDDEDKENIQELGEDYIRMGVVKAKKRELPEPFIEEFEKSVLVVGGGVSGMTAALEVAKSGYPAHLVEKSDKLGGWLNSQYKTFTQEPPYTNLIPSDPSPFIKEIEGNENISLHLNSITSKISGAPGKFDVTLQNGKGSEEFKVGSIIMATGWKPYDANKLDDLGYGKHKNVISSIEMEKMAKEGSFVRPSDGKPAQNIVFIQCAGSRDPEHLPYCSYTCCITSLKQALYVREKDQNAKVYVIYKDIRTPGHFEDFYMKAQENEGIFLTKGEISEINTDNGNDVTVAVKDTLLGDDISIEADLVVLATGMIPNSADGEALRAAKDKLLQAKNDEKEEEVKIAEGELANLSEPILNLTYRQGPDLPQLKYDFPDSHFVCFPYESRRTGIYPCGTVRKPMTEVDCYNDAAGAALKAIQAIETITRGEAVHPRSGDTTFPELFLQRCTSCKRCTEECPFGAYDEDEKGTPLPNPTRCRRCGICMGSCPERIISFKDYSVDIIGSMIKSIEIPEEDEEKPRIVCFICENDALPVVDMAATHRLQFSPYVRFIPLRCLGSFNIVWIADALSKGIDGILLLGCKHGEDYQCHFIKGSELATTRMEKVSETLERLVLESERIRVHEIAIDEYNTLPSLISDFEETLEELGPNPYKDF